MFVFGFVGDSLVATTTEPLLGGWRGSGNSDALNRKEHLAEEVAAGESGYYTHLSDVGLSLSDSESCKVTSPSLSPAIVSS